VNARDSNEETPLSYAIHKKSLKTVQCLLDEEAIVEIGHINQAKDLNVQRILNALNRCSAVTINKRARKQGLKQEKLD